LRNYIDNISSSTRQTRKRVHDNSQFVASETKAPANAPRWTLAGYNGSLSSYIEEHVVNNDERVEEHETPVPPVANEEGGDKNENNNEDKNEADNTVGEGGKGGDENDGNSVHSNRSKSVVSEAYDSLTD
jgi:hypothetical protein